MKTARTAADEEVPTMEYLVTMTTHVPDGTADEAVQDIRTREAARSRQLAAQGHLLRLWRPPLQPGEWRTLGLFAADDGGQLEEVLASMPLRIWRTDEVTPLSPHPNDPALARSEAPQSSRPAPTGAVEFLTMFTITVPEGTSGQTVDDTKVREAHRALELADQGHLLRLWSPPVEPGEWRTLGFWRAEDATAMQAILESLPLYAWMKVETTPLTQHPNDPAITTS
jgi:muconolactone delta-isomerase